MSDKIQKSFNDIFIFHIIYFYDLFMRGRVVRMSFM